jgi:hypothetical protein
MSPLRQGQYVRWPDNSVWYVDYVSPSGAYILPVTGYSTIITTSKKKGSISKDVIKYHDPKIISIESVLEVVDEASLDQSDIRRRVMARKAEGVAEMEKGATVEGAAKERAPRTLQKYVRTTKEAKEMKGQGRIVLDYLNSTTTPKTVTEVTEAVKGGITTKQDPERVVGFYLTKFKRDGLVNTTKAGEPETVEGTEPVETA